MNAHPNNYRSSHFTTTHHNSRKKRAMSSSSSVPVLVSDHPRQPRPAGRKWQPPAAAAADPAIPQIARPCTECGKKFRSWKALFGHMRCHPERQWRGINPPPNFRQRRNQQETSEEDSEMAACLLMLANGVPADHESSSVATTGVMSNHQSGMPPEQHYDCSSTEGLNCRFECSGCKKVFGSHQALGGHRASHKNVKGCYAITTKKDEDHHRHHLHGIIREDDSDDDGSNDGHKCSICSRVFTSGQALGGHMRCHWEKAEEPSRVSLPSFDLNMPALPHDNYNNDDDDDDNASAVYSSIILPANTDDLDLRLGL